jgi:predicted Zn-dependent protease
MGVKYIDEEMAEIFLLKIGGMIENEGYDACLQKAIPNLRIKGDKTTNPEVLDTYELIHAEAVAEGKPVPDVIIDFAEGAHKLKSDTLQLTASCFRQKKTVNQQYAGGGSKYYKVRRGDTLGSIARRNGTTVNKLCRLNGLRKTSIIRPGQRLKLR